MRFEASTSGKVVNEFTVMHTTAVYSSVVFLQKQHPPFRCMFIVIKKMAKSESTITICITAFITNQIQRWAHFSFERL